MRKLQAFEATVLNASRTKSRAEYHPVPRRPSRGNPVNPVPTNVTGGILAAQDSTGIPVPVPCEHWVERMVGSYTACGIPLVQSANGNGNGIPVNKIPFNRIPFPFVSVKKILTTSVNSR